MGFEVGTWLQELGMGQYTDAFRQNDVDARALPLLTNDDLKEIGVSLGHRKILLAAIQEFDQQDHVDSSATSLLPDQAVKNDEAERRHLTVFFADLVGSTELTNQLDPEDMRLLLQTYQDAVAGAVSRYGGFVAKYLGDGLLVFFGWPRAFEDHALRAVKAGLEAISRVQKLRTPSGQPLAARIGIASGDVVVGDTIGENTHEEGAMTGPILNLAARLQEKAPPNTVVLTQEDSQAMLHRIFEFSSLGRVELKGFEDPRELLQVVSERQAESRFKAAHRDDGSNQLVGRSSEKGILQQTWLRAHAGQGEVILLTGEAGIGKSRLTEEFLNDVTKAGQADIIRLNCSPYLTSSPFHPVTERISQDAGVEPGFDDDQVLRHVRAMLEARQGIDLDQVLPVFAALVAPASALARDILDLSPQEQRDITVQTLIKTVQARSQVKPVVLCVEDAHWIDPSTNALLDRFRAICADLPLMILITHRPGWELQRDAGDAHVQTLHLRRFNFEQVENLIQNISGQSPDASLVRLIMEKTDGVPLFVEELTSAYMEAGEENLAVPSSLKGALMARLDAVSPEAKQMALTGAVIGREFPLDLLAEAIDLERPDLQSGLAELVETGLVFESGHSGGQFVFRHALIRDTAYQSMLSATRRAQHANVAKALTRLRSAEIARRPELVARHLTEAEDWQVAFTQWKLATEMALARSASQEAMTNATEALNAAENLGTQNSAETITAMVLVGRSYDSLGDLPQGIAKLKQASDAARTLGHAELSADIAQHFADSCMMSSQRHNEAISLCLEALNGLPEDDERRQCQLMSQLARAYMFIGQFNEGAEYGHRAMKLAANLGDYKSQFSVMMMRFGAPFVARQDEEARNWRQNLQAMHDVAEKLGTIDQGRDRTLSLFVGAEMADRVMLDRSLKLLTEVSQKDNHLQLYWVQIHARAMVAIMEGAWQQAEAFATEAVKIGRKTHGKHIEGVFGVQMFTIRREQNRLHEVAPVIKKLMEEDPDDITWKPGFGLIAAELGYSDPAERILNELAAKGFDLPADAMYSTTLSYLADICVAVGRQDHAQTLFDLLLPYEDLTITAGATTVCTGAAARRLGNLATLLGDRDIAEHMLTKAIEIDTNMASPPWIAHSKASYASALRKFGHKQNPEHAFHLEAEALAIAQNLGMISLMSKLEGTVT
ncbi:MULTISPECIES: adenylate/guanylate cyclase domain-containing protein [unclassified Ruegeria]|uniref:AAA family ATPase n=1 Tax=unclassified Ruegeria TaxID=2625375 RepID=UPI001ADA4294|nr:MULTISPECIES: adenylate/guanylate cyclase domain-containing protein [unclassified Ruegeria]MBO9412541.1 AAA family ATPase [Ruegeria sp. R8_1]MBO9416221.1 AAA family ATPase [Ruegeria sp. R8_2]